MRLGANPYPAATDDHFMYEALRLAHRGLGWTSPNPPVGCVLVRAGEIVGRGWHNEPGGLHAETAALADCADPRGATAYITLEPCSHVGRQPACTAELARAGIARVVYGCDDVDPRSASKAASLLRASNIQVTSSVLSDDCRKLLLPYLHAKSTGRPHVHLKLALSLDGKMALANGVSQWLSGSQSRGLAHYLRQQYDAALVGRGTVLADNPRLTVRPDVLHEYMDIDGLRLRDPVRVVVDPQLRLLADMLALHLAQPGNQRRDLPQLVLVCSNEAAAAATNRLPGGTVLVPVAMLPSGALDLRAALGGLYMLGLTSLLVEGGARLASEVIAQNVVDYLTLVYTPLILGDDALGFTPPLQALTLAGLPRRRLMSAERLGEDVALSLDLT